jgi:hypothetical protein
MSPQPPSQPPVKPPNKPFTANMRNLLPTDELSPADKLAYMNLPRNPDPNFRDNKYAAKFPNRSGRYPQ